MRLWVVLSVLLSVSGLAGQAAQAQIDKEGRQTGIMLQSGDYDSFKIPAANGPGACAQACERDPRCRAWTYVKPVLQCRLKHTVGVAVRNNCCISGIKEQASAGNSRQQFCADYASQAVSANDTNLQQDCKLKGNRWSAKYRDHFAWCIRAGKGEAEAEAQTRSAELERCTRRADSAADALCDHYGRMAMIMVDAQARADCGFNTDKDRWSEEQKLHVRACQKAPNRVPEAQFEARQKQLSRCFERSGREEEACIAFADDAVAQYDKAVAAACEFGESRQWNSSKSRHYVWCLDASKQQREEMSYQRERDLSECRRQASLRRACGDYADKAVEQALLNDNERCGLKGDGWSKYKDDHVAFCMREGERQARREADGRQDELERCIAQNSRRNDECEQYADRAVRLAKINDERNCGNRDRRLWSTNSREHYDFCMRAKPGVRQEVQQQRRKAIQSCSIFRGFRLQITF